MHSKIQFIIVSDSYQHLFSVTTRVQYKCKYTSLYSHLKAAGILGFPSAVSNLSDKALTFQGVKSYCRHPAGLETLLTQTNQIKLSKKRNYIAYQDNRTKLKTLTQKDQDSHIYLKRSQDVKFVVILCHNSSLYKDICRTFKLAKSRCTHKLRGSPCQSSYYRLSKSACQKVTSE